MRENQQNMNNFENSKWNSHMGYDNLSNCNKYNN